MQIFCPRCGQEQVSPEVRFCSRCGFVMNGIADIILKGGLPDGLNGGGGKPHSARRRGLKHGGGWFLLGVVMVPLLAVLHELFRFPDEFVGLAAVVFFIGGIVRMVYALIFESGEPGAPTIEQSIAATTQTAIGKAKSQAALPESSEQPADAYFPPRPEWRDTNDLQPRSVTDPTTKLLGKEQK